MEYIPVFLKHTSSPAKRDPPMAERYLLLKSQPCFLEKRTKQVLLGAFLSERVFNQQMEFFHGVRGNICKVSPFCMTPHLLHGIKLRSIFRQPFNLDTFREKEILKNFCSVDTPSIQNQDDFSPKAFSESLKEAKNIFSSDVVLMDGEEKPQVSSTGRNTNGADNREAVMSFLLIQNRSFSFGCPSASGKWLKHKSALIQENNGAITSFRVFLYATTSFAATVLLLPCSVLWHSAGVSDNSSLTNVGVSTHEPDGRLCRNAPLLAWLSWGVSRVGRYTREQVDLEEVVPEAVVFAPKTDGKVCGDEVLLSMLFCHHLLLFASNDVLKKVTNQLLLLPREDLNPSSTTLWLSVFELLMLLESLLVSCIILYINSFRNASVNNNQIKFSVLIFIVNCSKGGIKTIG